MNCRCLSGCHPVISKQFSPSPTATTHSPCGRFSHFSLIWHWIWFWICTSTNSASPTGSYWGKRSCIWTLACTTQARWFLEKKIPWQMFHSQETPFDFNVLLHSYFKCPDVRRCQVSPQQQKVNPSKRKKFLTTNGMWTWLICLRWPDWTEWTSWIGPEPHWRDLTLDFPRRYLQYNLKAWRNILTEK